MSKARQMIVELIQRLEMTTWTLYDARKGLIKQGTLEKSAEEIADAILTRSIIEQIIKEYATIDTYNLMFLLKNNLHIEQFFAEHVATAISKFAIIRCQEK